MLISRLSEDVGDARMDHLNKTSFKRVAKDWKIYLGTLAYFGVLNTGYAGSVRITHQLSHSYLSFPNLG